MSDNGELLGMYESFCSRCDFVVAASFKFSSGVVLDHDDFEPFAEAIRKVHSRHNSACFGRPRVCITVGETKHEFT